MNDEREPLTEEQAIAMLPDGDTVHTFRQAGYILIGADWDGADVVQHIRDYGAELSGDNATSMGHGIVIIDSQGPLFVETRKKEHAIVD